MFAELLDTNEKQLFYKLAEALIMSDNKVDDEEKKYLEGLKNLINPNDKTTYEDSLIKLSEIDNSKKRAIISELLIIAKCDNDYADCEKQLLSSIAENIGIPDEVVSELNVWTDKYLEILKEGTKLIEG